MKRINKLLEIMKEKGCDSAIITDRSNIRYLSGFTGSAGFLIISEKELLLITDFRYTEQAGVQAKSFEIKNSATFSVRDYAAKFESTGFEDFSISYSDFMRFGNLFKRLVPMGNAITEIRSVKDDGEISDIRKASEIANEAFLHVLNFIKEGVSEISIARELEFYMLSHGAQKLSFDTIVATGAHGSYPHATPDERTIKKGDLIVMDYGCVVNGYCSDMTRTVGVGAVDDECVKAYNTVLKAQLSCLDMIKPDSLCSDIHNNAFNIIDSQYKGLFGHSLGHGVGLEIHELPNLSSKSARNLVPGNVVTNEPGVYIPGKCGVRIEDLIVVTENGYENLCSSPKELILV